MTTVRPSAVALAALQATLLALTLGHGAARAQGAGIFQGADLALGQKRAEAVRRALGLLGVADNQMEAVSFGKEKPAATGSTEAAFEKNRRAEISYR